MRKIIVTTTKETPVSAEELYALRLAAFEQWKENGLTTRAGCEPVEGFDRYMKGRTVFVARDAETGELLAMHTFSLNPKKGTATGANLAVSPKAKREGIASRMLEQEVERLRKAGYRYLLGSTGIPAVWSVQWHRKNGYYITGFSRNERDNYASYMFRKQIAIDVRHHPTDLLWMKPIAPITAKLQYVASYLATNICKTREGRLNWLGRLGKRLLFWSGV